MLIFLVKVSLQLITNSYSRIQNDTLQVNDKRIDLEIKSKGDVENVKVTFHRSKNGFYIQFENISSENELVFKDDENMIIYKKGNVEIHAIFHAENLKVMRTGITHENNAININYAIN